MAATMQKLVEYASRGDEAKVQALAKKGEATFADFADAFNKHGPVRALLDLCGCVIIAASPCCQQESWNAQLQWRALLIS